MEPLSLGAGSFAAPSGTAGVPVTFNGSAADPYSGFEPSWDFGDGATGAGAHVSHTYSAPGDYTVTMTPRDELTGSTGTPVSHQVAISAPSSGGGGDGGGGGEAEGGSGTGGGVGGSAGGTATGGTGGTATGPTGAGATSTSDSTASSEGGSGGAAGSTSAPPSARVVHNSAKASRSGVVKLLVACAASGPACTGTVMLRARLGTSHAAKNVTLGSASFSAASGETVTVTLHLSAKARTALAHGHSLHATVTITLHASSGAAHTLTIHLAAAGGGSH